jgi:hypothetical protein
MAYYLDHAALTYLLEEFPKTLLQDLWEQFEHACHSGSILSDRETKARLETELSSDEAVFWLDGHKSVFQRLAERDAQALGRMMKNGMFDFYEKRSGFADRKLPEGLPFIIAMAKVQRGKVIYRKSEKDYLSIVRICGAEHIDCAETEAFLLELRDNAGL